MFSEANKEIEDRSTSPGIIEDAQVPKLFTRNSLQQEINTDRCNLN